MTLDEYLAKQSPTNAQIIKILIIIGIFVFIFGLTISIHNFKNKENDSENPIELNSILSYLIGAVMIYVLIRWWSFGLYLTMVFGLIYWFG
jgi:uncharacterized membrane protein HdeD (DUF308 family)